MQLEPRLNSTLPVFVLLAGMMLASPSRADLQDDLNARWRGAWIILKSDIASNCNGMTTDNRISGDLLRSNGRFGFEPGELAQITKVDSRRRRVDVKLELRESMLVPYQDGPFTLYREVACDVELVIDFNDRRTRDMGLEGIESEFDAWFERHAKLDDAMDSPGWNGREREDYPVDYEETLFAYENWKVDQHNQLVLDRIDESREATGYLLAQVSTDADFGTGLARGIAAMRDSMSADCDRLVSSSLRTFSTDFETSNSDQAAGYQTGEQLAYHIELSRRLGDCLLPPPSPEIYSFSDY